MLSTSSLIQHLVEFFTVPDDSLQYCTFTFLFAFIIFYGIYLLAIRGKRYVMMAYMILFSLFFGYKINGWMVLLLPATVVVSWLLTERIRNTVTYRERKIYLMITLLVVLAPLLYFKYTNFGISTLNSIIAANFELMDIFLPVGISFYTFQAISYVVDVYKGRFEERATLLEYTFYLTFFPLMLAGPITRASTLIPQLKQQKIDYADKDLVYSGLFLITLGILKKGLIADYIAQYNNWIFEDPMSYSGFENVMGVLGYTLQIYCDFSGYSDISIGLASLLGFRLLQNFNSPYRSLNLSEFWHRWHIALSTWLRDYVYIPLGGNRKGKIRTYVNNMATMLIAGLWHGASWMFVAWGGIHGLGLMIHKMNKPWLDRVPDTWPVRCVCWLITFIFVAGAWIFFRAPSFEGACMVYERIFTDFSMDYLMPFCKARPTWITFVAIAYSFQAVSFAGYEKARLWFVHTPWIVKLLLFMAAVQLVINFRTSSVQPFIYAQF